MRNHHMQSAVLRILPAYLMSSTLWSEFVLPPIHGSTHRHQVMPMTEATTPTGPSQEALVQRLSARRLRRERLTAFNRRLASTCYSFGGIAFLMFLVLLASDSCEDER